jgi:hypothetical protein
MEMELFRHIFAESFLRKGRGAVVFRQPYKIFQKYLYPVFSVQLIIFLRGYLDRRFRFKKVIENSGDGWG